MTKSRTLLIALCAAAMASPSLAMSPAFVLPTMGASAEMAQGQRVRDQDRAFRATREGRSMPLPQIERRVMPHMNGADYLGPEFRGRNYRLKFMDQGRVIWVDVDAATGRILRRSGN
jgi:hypothetical protein